MRGTATQKSKFCLDCKADITVRRWSAVRCKECAKKRVVERALLWVQENRERHRKNALAYAHRNMHKIRAWRLGNPEKIKESKRKFHSKNPLWTRVYLAHRRAHGLQLPGKHTVLEFAAKWKSQDRKCAYCQCDLPLTLATQDHVIPVTHEKCTNDISNIVASCKSCNSRKSNKLDVAIQLGLI